ncbi:HHIP-like protein 2 [Pomacea canaliculata]|uniref:HHIP-like protein 2 n=1 Tax=Pomacea canaliculata TaxID=400727 RepID=UPI000D730628|nr:HHIP-like protein 2 [Pomacea canaliculata]
MSVKLLGEICSLWVLWAVVHCHPQCRDGSPPAANPELDMCDMYRQECCCMTPQDVNLGEEYELIRHRLAEQDWRRCRGYVRDLLCSNCSPIAAHLFDTDLGSDAQRRELPGMCPEFCRSFFASCRDTLWFLYPDVAPLVASMNSTTFCERYRILDLGYCTSKSDEQPQAKLSADEFSNKNADEVCVCLEKVADRLANPVFARSPRDHSGRLFVGEQSGMIYVVDSTTRKNLKTTFLNIENKVLLSPSFGDERGLVGMVLHPNFTHNGRFFIYYSTALNGTEDSLREQEKELNARFVHKVRVSELFVSSRDPEQADPESERILLEVFKPFANHNGGEMFFLDDGYLYITIGDGGGAGDVHNLAQNKSWLLGKILRIDVDSDTPGAYGIPHDNPFVQEAGARAEIFTYGVRNTWRCGVDSGDEKTGAGKGRVLCGDVGQSKYEELNLLKKGANYGWRAREGFSCYDPTMCGEIGPEELPVYAYNHSIGQSVTGGEFYRGCRSPALNGKYVYGDYMVGRLFTLEEKDGRWENKDLKPCASSTCNARGLTSQLDRYILSFGLDEEGEVLVLTSNSSKNKVRDGGVYRLVDPFSGSTEGSCHKN